MARRSDRATTHATATETWRELRTRGFRADEAGNLTAWLSGLPPVAGGWRPREIEALLFLRHLVGSDRGACSVHPAPAA